MERKSVLTIQAAGKKHSVYLDTGQNLREVIHQFGLYRLSFPREGNSISGSA
jgi:hypothetical protein